MTAPDPLFTHPALSFPDPTPRGAGRIPRIVAVASGKGGVGKTFLAITLAHAMARLGRRVLLFDGDLGLANVDVQLGLMPKRDLGSVAAGEMGLAEAAVPYAEGGFEVVAGRSGSGALAHLAQDRIAGMARALTRAAEAYDHVVVDVGAGLDAAVLRFAAIADAIVVVATEEPTSLTDAYAFIKFTAADHPGRDFRILVNRAQGETGGQRTYETLAKACRTFLKLEPPLLGIIREDRHVPEAIRRQTALLVRSPLSDAAVDAERAARRLIGP